MRTVLFALLLSVVSVCSYAQHKTEKEMEQEKIKLKELIQQELATVTQYSHQPAYYVQVNKNSCRIIVKVDDLPQRTLNQLIYNQTNFSVLIIRLQIERLHQLRIMRW